MSPSAPPPPPPLPGAGLPVMRRRTGRLLPLYGDAVLLLRGRDPLQPDAGQWWFTVGGGCEPGESTAQAARREAYEETGLVLPDDLGPVVLQRASAFAFDGVWLEQTEDYYCCRVLSSDVVTTGWTELEQRSVTGFRWWTVPELLAADEPVYPPGLAALVARLVDAAGRGGPGAVSG